MSESHLEDTAIYEYLCGHVFSKSRSACSSGLDFTSSDSSGKQARPYQETGVEFVLETDFNAIVADQMRLGKTPTALLALKNAYKERTPCLIIVKGANLWQWVREYKTWADVLPNGIYPIVGSASPIFPGFSAYIISMDTFSRPAVLEKLKKLPFKLLIVDEAHSFKNTDSNRAQALIDFLSFLNQGERSLDLTFSCARCKHEWVEKGKQKYDKRIGHQAVSKSARCPTCNAWCFIQQQAPEGEQWSGEEQNKYTALIGLSKDPSTTSHERELALQRASELKERAAVVEKAEKPCGLILLTGTPILNRADEYFVPLNLINPLRFTSLEKFRREWLVQDAKGRWSQVKSYRVEEFKAALKPNFIRREKEDVFKELPPINIISTLIEPDKELWAREYNKIVDRMELKMAQKADPSYWDLADDMMELRRICGMMKIMWTADYLEGCALESPAKYAIGIHHEAVRDVLYLKLGGELNCHKLSGENNIDSKDQIMREWEHDKKQFLIINMLAGGVGMDFHYCDNVVVLERQWSREIERQFEFRFYNPDIAIKKNPLTIEYVVAKGTFEAFWLGMLEEKQRNVDPIVYNNYDISKDSASFRELIEQTLAARL